MYVSRHLICIYSINILVTQSPSHSPSLLVAQIFHLLPLTHLFVYLYCSPRYSLIYSLSSSLSQPIHLFILITYQPNQSTNQSINWSISQSNRQASIPSINQSINLFILLCNVLCPLPSLSSLSGYLNADSFTDVFADSIKEFPPNVLIKSLTFVLFPLLPYKLIFSHPLTHTPSIQSVTSSWINWLTHLLIHFSITHSQVSERVTDWLTGWLAGCLAFGYHWV